MRKAKSLCGASAKKREQKRLERNKRKGMTICINYSEHKRVNPKKVPSARRVRNNKGVFVGYIFSCAHYKRDPFGKIPPIFKGFAGFNTAYKPTAKMNKNLISRAIKARSQGGYFRVNGAKREQRIEPVETPSIG